MRTLNQYDDQDLVAQRLRQAIDRGRVAHAYLFSGSSSSGTYELGRSFAAAVNCTHSPDGCGTCDSCQKIAENTHPDVITLEPEGASNTIPIATVRSHVIARLSTAPHEGQMRVFLIREACTLLGPSANALLKTLEEPPARTLFILATQAPEQLLPTIRSRCQQMVFSSSTIDNDAILEQDDVAQKIRAVRDILYKAIISPVSTDKLAASQEIGTDRHETVAALRQLANLLCDHAKQAALARRNREACTLSQCAQAVLDTERPLLQHNAHPQLTVEALLQKLSTTACIARP